MIKKNKNLSKITSIFKKFKIDIFSSNKINLFDLGVFNSYSYLELISELELKLKIKFTDKEMFNKKNGHLNYLLKLILKKIK
jgi:acyl carrier protein